jgi:hypothetical protein
MRCGAIALGEVKNSKGGKNEAVEPKTHTVWTVSTDGTHSYANSWALR